MSGWVSPRDRDLLLPSRGDSPLGGAPGAARAQLFSGPDLGQSGAPAGTAPGDLSAPGQSLRRRPEPRTHRARKAAFPPRHPGVCSPGASGFFPRDVGARRGDDPARQRAVRRPGFRAAAGRRQVLQAIEAVLSRPPASWGGRGSPRPQFGLDSRLTGDWLMGSPMALALLFAGQGAQKVGMGRSLSESSAAARALYAEAGRGARLGPGQGELRGPRFRADRRPGCASPRSSSTGSRSLAALKREGASAARSTWRLGLSLGEVTACAAAGVFDFPTGLRDRGGARPPDAGRMRAERGLHGGGHRRVARRRLPALPRVRRRGRELQRARARSSSRERRRSVAAAVAAAKERGIRRSCRSTSPAPTTAG